MKQQKKPLSIGVLILVLVLVWWLQRQEEGAGRSPDRAPPGSSRTDHAGPAEKQAPARPGNEAIHKAFRQRRSGVWVEGSGEIVHLLPDDRHPPRHQLFLVEVGQGQTIKISHNVDLAPKVPVQKGEQIAFRGRFEHNDKGGVVHWTHRDPGGRKQGGWLSYAGKTYK